MQHNRLQKARVPQLFVNQFVKIDDYAGHGAEALELAHDKIGAFGENLLNGRHIVVQLAGNLRFNCRLKALQLFVEMTGCSRFRLHTLLPFPNLPCPFIVKIFNG
ncbi:hypothetical protein D3C71_1616510 [compost metagenome]